MGRARPGILFSQLDTGAADRWQFSAGSWTALQASQQRVIDAVIERQVDNFVVLTGDVHRNDDLDILANFDDPASRPVGVELAGTSTSSGGDGRDSDAGVDLRPAENPHLEFAHGRTLGWVDAGVLPLERAVTMPATSRLRVAVRGGVVSPVLGYSARMTDAPDRGEHRAATDDEDVEVADVSGGAVPEELLDDGEPDAPTGP